MSGDAPQIATERELKLSAWPEFALPDLDGVLPGVRAAAAAERSLDAVYFDTADLRLLRRGVTVRFRRGDRGGDVWTVKLPELAAIGLARREISIAGAPGTVPGLLRDLTRGWAFGAPLERVATIRTGRRTLRLLAADGRPVAVIDDDDVRGLRGRRVAARFRELEIELAADAPATALRALDRALQAAGALPAPQVPKLARTLGPTATEPWDLAAPSLAARPTAGELVRARLVDALAAVVDGHAAVVLDDDPAAARGLADGLARLAGDLRLLRPLLDARRAADLERHVEAAARALAAVADRDAALATLRADAAEAGLGDGADAVLEALSRERTGSHERAAARLRSAGYGALLGDLRAVALDPPLRPRARRRAERVLPALAGSAVRRLREDVARAAAAGAPEAVAAPARALRDAVDLAAPLAGKPAERTRRDVRRLAESIDALRRDRASAARLRAVATAADARTAWAAGVLAGIALQRAAETAERIAAATRQLDREGRWAWLP